MKELFNEVTGHSLVVMTFENLQKALEIIYNRARDAAVADIYTRSTHEKESLITKKEAMTLLGKSANTMWKWAKRGYLVPTKVGGTSMYKMSEINKIMGL